MPFLYASGAEWGGDPDVSSLRNFNEFNGVMTTRVSESSAVTGLYVFEADEFDPAVTGGFFIATFAANRDTPIHAWHGFPISQSEVVLHAWLNLNSLAPSGDHTYYQTFFSFNKAATSILSVGRYLLAAAGKHKVVLRFGGTGEFGQSGGTLVESASHVLSNFEWVKLTLHADTGTGDVDLWVNDTLAITTNQSMGVINRFYLGNSSDSITKGPGSNGLAPAISFDDVFVTNSLSDFGGGAPVGRVYFLPTAADGSLLEWKPTPPATHWDLVTGTPPDVSDFIFTEDKGVVDRFLTSAGGAAGGNRVLGIQAAGLSAVVNEVQNLQPFLRYTTQRQRVTSQIVSATAPKAHFGRFIHRKPNNAHFTISEVVADVETCAKVPGVDWRGTGPDIWPEYQELAEDTIDEAAVETEEISTFGSFSGVAKWWGGVLAPNGKIYGVPADAQGVIQIDPETKSATAFGSLGTTTRKWLGSTLAHTEMIYCAPYTIRSGQTHIEFLKIDPTTGTATPVSTGLGFMERAWAGASVAPNGMVYCIPADAETVLKINPNTDGVSTFGALGSDTFKWHGGVLAPNGMIYGIPWNATAVLKINPTNDTVTTFGSLSHSFGWESGVLAPNGKIYCIPADDSAVLVINTNNDTLSTIGNLAGFGKWRGGFFAPNGFIYGIPWGSSTFLRIDPKTDTVDTISGPSGTAKWAGGVMAFNGKAYGIPYNNTEVVEIDLGLRLNFPTDLLLSAYWNHL